MWAYILRYVIATLIVMALLLVLSRKFRGGAKFRRDLAICAGFLMGWISAFLAVYIYFS